MHPGFTPDGPATGLFPSTRWSLIIQAAAPATPQAREALEELCSLYWHPVYAFIRRKGNDPDWALDLTQDFFARLQEKGVRNRRTTSLHQCTRNRFPTPYLPSRMRPGVRHRNRKARSRRVQLVRAKKACAQGSRPADHSRRGGEAGSRSDGPHL